MSDRVPAWLQPTLERIVEPAAPEPMTVPTATDALADLLSWWDARSVPGQGLVAETVIGAGSIAEGIAAADRAIDAGATVVVPRVADRDDVVSRSIIALLCNRDAAAVMFQTRTMTDRAWMEDCIAVRDAVTSAVEFKGLPVELVERLGTSGQQYAVGVLLGSAARSTPCLIDGVDVLAASLVADRLAFRASRWWRLGSRSPDPAITAAADRMELDQGLAFDLTDDTGLGAEATLALLEFLLR